MEVALTAAWPLCMYPHLMFGSHLSSRPPGVSAVQDLSPRVHVCNCSCLKLAQQLLGIPSPQQMAFYIPVQVRLVDTQIVQFKWRQHKN